MTDTEKKQKFLVAKGEATGRIKGINHLQLVVKDLDESIRFYRDLLGFKVVRTQGAIEVGDYATTLGMKTPAKRNYFVDMGNGSLITLMEVTHSPPPDAPMYAYGLWPNQHEGSKSPTKMDHLAFNVDTREDLVWFHERLVAAGVPCGKILFHADIYNTVRAPFLESFYFYDPNGIALEMATFHWGHAKWKKFDPEDWLVDEDPVAALLEK